MKEIAVIYDFDGTLAKGNIPEHNLFSKLGLEINKFWSEVRRVRNETDSDEIAVYMYLLMQKASEKGMYLTKKLLEDSAKNNVPFFEGVETWFSRIKGTFSNEDYIVNHYIISSGLQEMIEATTISKDIKKVFASKYIYGKDSNAVSPGVTINYTSKVQYLFRINKGIFNHWDNESLNSWIPLKDRQVPFSRMIYIGDGDTDIPAMKTVRSQGGISIAVFDPEKWENNQNQERIYKLISEDRVQYVTPADYRDGSQLDIVVKGVIDRMINENL